MQYPSKDHSFSNNSSKQSGTNDAFADLMSPFSLPSSNQSLSQKPLNSLPAQSLKNTATHSFPSHYTVNNFVNTSSNASNNGSIKNTVALNSIKSPPGSTSPAPSLLPNYSSKGLDSLDPFARSVPLYPNTASPDASSGSYGSTGFPSTFNTPSQSVSSKIVANNQYQSNMNNSSYIYAASKVQSTNDSFDMLSFGVDMKSNSSKTPTYLTNKQSTLKQENSVSVQNNQEKAHSQIPLSSISAWNQLDVLEKKNQSTLIAPPSNTEPAKDVFDLEYLQQSNSNQMSQSQQDDRLLDFFETQSKTSPGIENSSESNMERLISMGFDEPSSRKALENAKNDIDKAIALLVNTNTDKLQGKSSNEQKLEDMIHELMKMGFDYEPCKASLISSGLDTQVAVGMLLREGKRKEPKASNGKNDHEKDLEQLLQAGFHEADCRYALQTCNGDINAAMESLLNRQCAVDNENYKTSSNRFDANSIVGTASQIGISVLKSAKSALSIAKKKVGEVLNEKGGSINQVSEREWTNANFKDSSFSDINGKSAKPYSPDVELNRQNSMDSVEIPLERKSKINNSTLDMKKNSTIMLPLEGNLLELGSEPESHDFKLDSKPTNTNFSETAAKSLGKNSVKATNEQIQKSSDHKMKGNEYFKQGQFGDAETEYTLGIECLPLGHDDLIPLYNNRAACRLKNGNNKGAVNDCDYILNIIADDLKALLRRATAYEALENWEMARDDYRKIMGIDSSVKGSLVGLARVNGALKPKADNMQSTFSEQKKIVKPQALSVKKAVDEAVQKVRQSIEAKEQLENQKFAASEAVEKKINDWKNNKETNIRALLSSLENVLWPECGWKPITLGDLISPAQVKKRYMQAVAKVHPDKLDFSCTVEQQMIASSVFTVLNKAWDSFKVANGL